MSKDFVRVTSKTFIIGFFSFIVLSSCENVKIKSSEEGHIKSLPQNDKGFIIGTWEAEWMETSPIQVEHANLSMKGKIKFKENGKVQIEAFGHEGCVFLSDTVYNEMQYEISGRTINMRAEDDNFGLPYQIVTAEDNLVKLTLMEDITITLTRQ